MTNKTWILHIDGDGFFAYCEIARFPELKGKPVVVGADRGIACAMTYEAKALGITRGMPIFKIRDLFPEVRVLSSHFELYEHYGNKLSSILKNHVDSIERYSIDECFAKISLPGDWSKKEIEKWLINLKNEVQKKIGLTYSFGLARTKVLAKVGSKFEKPNGATVITDCDEEHILKITPIESIWGIGRQLYRRLYNERVGTAHDFKNWPKEKVVHLFNRPVQELWLELNGKSVFEVANSTDPHKSMQATKSFGHSSTDLKFISAELLQNLDIAFARARQHRLVTDSISIFLKTIDRYYHSAHVAIPHFTDNPLDISELIVKKIKSVFKMGTKYKATGVALWNMRGRDSLPLDLFGEQNIIFEKNKLMDTVDIIRSRFGNRSISILAALPSTRARIGKSVVLEENARYIYGLPLPYLGEVN